MMLLYHSLSAERVRRIRIHPGLTAAAACIVTVFFGVPSLANTVTFGSGGNTFNMEFVPIGNPGNADDTTGNPNPAGAVGYNYGINKFEVSRDMITKYNANFGTANSLVITLDPQTGIPDGTGANKPATGTSWNEAARFVNWLNTSTGNQAAYKFTTTGVNDNIVLWQSGDNGYNALNPYRNSLAKYVLPSYNEWYKAAYYDPGKSGGAGYWDYANGSDTRPTAVTGGSSGAVYTQSGEASPTSPADVTNAGGLSPYGVMGLNGNVVEWEESSGDLANINGSSPRGFRGGRWNNDSIPLSSSTRLSVSPSFDNNVLGFRVAIQYPAVPGPLPFLGAAAGYGWSRQLRNRIKLACSPTSASKPS